MHGMSQGRCIAAACSVCWFAKSARRMKLQTLQEREAAKVRMTRLQTMLLQKLVLKYGSKRTPNSSLNKEIEEEVKAFTAARSGRRPPTDEEFLELENTVRELRAKCSKGGGGGDDGNRAGDGEDGGGSRGGSGKESRGSSRKGDEGADGRRGSSQGGLPPSIARAWRTFEVAKQIEYEIREKDKAENARLQKIKFRGELEILRREQAEKKLAEDNDKRKHMEEQEKRLEDFRKEQEAIKRRQADKHAEEKLLREEQVRRLQAEKEAERQARMQKELQDIALCKARLQGEVDVAERRRKAGKERLAAIQAENAQQRELRAQRQRESDEADAQLLLEHSRRMDEEERRRAEKLRERMKRYEEIGSFWSARGGGRTQADCEKREEQQTLIAARKKEEKVLERERSEKEKKRLAGMRMATENRRVIEEKCALAERRQKEEMEFSQRYINDSEAFKREEREKIAKKRAAMEKYRKQLEKQVEETKSRRMCEGMNDTEFRLNGDLVKRLEADKNMVAQVKQRMQNAH